MDDMVVVECGTPWRAGEVGCRRGGIGDGARAVWVGLAAAAVTAWSGMMAAAADGVGEGGVRALGILKRECVSCHSAEKRKGGLDVTTRDGLINGGEGGAAVVVGAPDESLLIAVLARDGDPHMPPKKQLDEAQIAVLSEWVRGGLVWEEVDFRVSEAAIRPVALSPLPADYRPVMAMAVSPDGNRLAVGSGADLVIYDIGAEAVTIRSRARAHFDPIQSMAWTPDGDRLITGAFRRIMVWQADPLTPEREVLSGLTDRITAMQVTPEGGQAVVADGLTGASGVVRILNIATGAIERSWPAHADTIFALALSPDGTTLATAGGDAHVRLWMVADGQESAQLEAHATQVLGVAFNGDATQLVTAGADRHLKVWDVKTRENIVALPAKPSAFNAVAWHRDGPVFAVTDEGVVWRYTDLKPHTGAQSSETGQERALGRAESPVFCLATTPDGQRMFAGTSDGRLLGWDSEGKALPTIELPTTTMAAAPAPAAPAPDETP